MFTTQQKVALSILVALVGSVILIKHGNRTSDDHTFTIGILQTASHPALNAARNGFVETVQKQLGPDVDFIFKNAEGSVAHAHTIAAQFHSNATINAIVAIATPAAQAMASVEKHKPIIIAAVTDPHAAGLIRPQGNVCGTSDMIDVTKQVQMLKELIPTAQKVAIVSNTAEVNASVLANKMEKALKKIKLQPIRIGITSEADIPAAIDMALRKADVILAPTDNSVASSIEFIANKALAAHKPLIVSDNLLVQFGALAARGVDYFQSGKHAADKALQILQHNKKPHELPITSAENTSIFINSRTLHTLGLTVPSALKPDVIFVKQK